MYPSVDGALVLPSILTMRPRSTETDRLQLSGQSSGQAVRTVDRPHDTGGEISGRAIAQCTGSMYLCAHRRDPSMASFQDRVIGVLKLQASTFEEVENDAAATVQAATVVGAAAVARALGGLF